MASSRTETVKPWSAAARVLYLLTFVGLAMVAYMPSANPAKAYVREPWEWKKTSLGYSTPPSLKVAAQEATAQWMAVSNLRFYEGGPDIEFLEAEPTPGALADAPPTLLCHTAACVAPYTIVHCKIRVGARFFAETPGQQEKLLEHELGHCLGLGHSDNASIMSVLPKGGLTWSDDDVSGIQSIYGAPNRTGWYRVMLPVLVRNP